MKVPSNSVDEFVFAMSGQYLFDPNERNTWGALGPYDLSNTQDIGNSGAATFIHTVGGLMFPHDMRVKEMRLRWRVSNANSEPFGYLLAHVTPINDSTATLTPTFVLDEVGDNGGVGPRDPTSTRWFLNEWTFDHVMPAGDLLTFGVESPTAIATNYYAQISAGYILLERA